MVTITNTNLEIYDVIDNAGGNIYKYHGFLEADTPDDAETCLNSILALKMLVAEPAIVFLGRMDKKKDLYYISFDLQGDE